MIRESRSIRVGSNNHAGYSAPVLAAHAPNPFSSFRKRQLLMHTLYPAASYNKLYFPEE